MEKQGEKPRKRVVVEEVAQLEKEAPKPQIDNEAAKTESKAPAEAPKAEVEEAVHHEDLSARIPEKFAPHHEERPKSGGKYFLLAIPLLLILGLLGGGIYVFTKGTAEPAPMQTLEPTIEETASPIPTPTATPSKADLGKFTIAVQNGSGIAGEATKAQKLLTDGGFKVSSIGNAKTYDFTDTIIEAKKSVDQAYLDQLNTILGKTYEMGKATTLADTEKTDVIVIIGKTKTK